MARDYTRFPHHHVRRRDRAVDDESWIKAFLHRAPFGVLALSLDDQPFVNTNIFVYDEARHLIYFHTAGEGRTRSIVECNDRVCFSISEMGRLLPATTAKEMSVEYTGVSIFGRISVVEEEEEAYQALQLLLDKYFPDLRPGEDYRATTPEEWKLTTVYRVRIEQWIGKQKKAPVDFPGARPYLPGNVDKNT
jgi:nitroimidazol reductase NimA-like FMN-containing flavoprotein (pyridoxamine 5'-phosphate oxidase superfamily)